MVVTSLRANVLGLALVAVIAGCGGGSASTVMPPPAPPPPPVSGTCTPAPTSTIKVSVKDAPYNAKGDGATDDTAAIQKAVTAIAGTGGTVTIPAGTYLLNPVASYNSGIRLGNNMTLSLDSGAILKALSTSTSNYTVLSINGVHNVNLQGGTIIGNRYNNAIADTNEAGTGVTIVNSSQVVVDGVTAQDCWADGFYVGLNSQSILFCNDVANNNRRSGMSVTSVDGMVVRGSQFLNSSGIVEYSILVTGNGVDIEPNLGETVNNIQFLGCTFGANASAGLAVGPSIANTGKAFVTNIVIDGNTATGNATTIQGAGIELSNTSGHQVINNVVTGNLGDGIYLRNGANDNLISGNQVTGTTAAPLPGDIGYGILLYLTSGNTVTGNTLTANAACGIRDAYPAGPNTISSNTLVSNGSNCQ